MWTGRPLIIDTDPGTDDAIALLVAAAEGLDVRLVVSTYGNVPHAHTKRNAVDLAGLLFPGTPVLYGADGPIEGRGHTAEYVHGANGVGARLRRLIANRAGPTRCTGRYRRWAAPTISRSVR